MSQVLSEYLSEMAINGMFTAVAEQEKLKEEIKRAERRQDKDIRAIRGY